MYVQLILLYTSIRRKKRGHKVGDSDNFSTNITCKKYLSLPSVNDNYILRLKILYIYIL